MGVTGLVFGIFPILNTFCKEPIHHFQQSFSKPFPCGWWQQGVLRIPMLVSLPGARHSSFLHMGARAQACLCRGLEAPCAFPPLGSWELGWQRR